MIMIAAVILSMSAVDHRCLADDPAESAWRVHAAPTIGGLFGLRVASIGDINNDGVEDYATSSPMPYYGLIHMYSGATGQLLRAIHRDGMELYAMAIASLGDVNGDNHDDVAIGTPARLVGDDLWGEVVVVSGQTGGELWSMQGMQIADLFGFSLARCGDINGDGIADLLVGAPGTNLPGNPESGRDVGAAFVLSGVTGAMLLSWTGQIPDGQAGYTVACPGDLNHDGTPDLAVAANIASRVFVIDGTDGFPIDQIDGQAGSGFGYSMATAGDVDADGVNDLIVGAPRFRIGGEVCGRASVFSGRTRQLIRGFTGADSAELGGAVAGVGDVDGDGYGDLLVAARQHPYGVNTTGRAVVYSGATGLRLKVISGPQGKRGFGSSVCGLTDLTGDGIPDFMIGHERFGQGLGAVYVFSGEPNPPGMMAAASYNPGWMSAGKTVVGDLDGDGAADLLTIGSAYDRVTVRMNKGWGEFWGPANLAVGGNPSDAALVDLDRDHDLDLVVTLAGENRIVLYTNTHGILLRSGTIKVGRQPVSVVARDIDGDGAVDIVVANRRDHSLSVVLQRRGVRHRMLHDRFRPARAIELPAEPTSVHLATLDSDNLVDLVAVSQNTSTVSALLNRGGGRFNAPIDAVLPAAPVSVAVADFDDDGFDDLAWCDGVNASVSIRAGSGHGLFFEPVTFALDHVPGSLRAVRANNDRLADLMLANPASSTATLLILPTGGDPPLIANQATVSEPRWLGTADLDNDNDTDAVLLNADGAVTVLLNQILN